MQTFARSERKNVIRACIASAAASLPLHMMALMIALAVRDGHVTVKEAGWMNASFMLGLFGSSVCIPLTGARRVTRVWAALATTAAVVSICLGAMLQSWALLASWTVVGTACGLLNFLGSTTAASTEHRHFAIGLRLALVLLSSASLIAVTQLVGGFHSYFAAVSMLALAFGLAVAAGLFRFQPLPAVVAHQGLPKEGRLGSFSSLLLIAVFFCGQAGFYAFSAHVAEMSSMDTRNLPWAYAFAKAIAAVVLLCGIGAGLGGPSLWLGLLLSAAIVTMTFATNWMLFGFGVLLFEVAVNLQSTRLQASVLSQHPDVAGLWIPACIAAGVGGGSIVFGAALGNGQGGWFVGFAVVTGLLPAALFKRTSRRHSVL